MGPPNDEFGPVSTTAHFGLRLSEGHNSPSGPACVIVDLRHGVGCSPPLVRRFPPRMRAKNAAFSTLLKECRFRSRRKKRNSWSRSSCWNRWQLQIQQSIVSRNNIVRRFVDRRVSRQIPRLSTGPSHLACPPGTHGPCLALSSVWLSRSERTQGLVPA